MIKKLLLILALFIILLHPQFIHAKGHEPIEIFDPQQNRVVKTIEPNKEINNMVEKWINEAEGIYPAIDPIKDDGYAIRFPLDPAIQVKNKWLNTIIEEIYLIIPEKGPAFFIVFEGESSPIPLLFIGNINKLSNLLDFQLK